MTNTIEVMLRATIFVVDVEKFKRFKGHKKVPLNKSTYV